jgi:hypothetical protein
LSAVAVIVVVAVNMASGPLLRVRKGRLGERLITDLLRQLPDEYLLVNDIVLGPKRGNVDHALVGPCGVLVIETKRLAGRIRCFGDQWYVNGYPARASAARSTAARWQSESSSRHGTWSRAIRLCATSDSVAVFTDPRCRLEVRGEKTIVARYSELLQVVLEVSRRRRVSAEVADRLAKSLVAA